jgi:hypothetical protein
MPLSEVGESLDCVASHNRASTNANSKFPGTIMCSLVKLVNRSMASRPRVKRHQRQTRMCPWAKLVNLPASRARDELSQKRTRVSSEVYALGLKLVNRSRASRACVERHNSEFETLEAGVLLSEVGESSDRIAAFTMGYFVVLAALVGHVRFLDRMIRHSGQGRPSVTPARL